MSFFADMEQIITVLKSKGCSHLLKKIRETSEVLIGVFLNNTFAKSSYPFYEIIEKDFSSTEQYLNKKRYAFCEEDFIY